MFAVVIGVVCVCHGHWGKLVDSGRIAGWHWALVDIASKTRSPNDFGSVRKSNHGSVDTSHFGGVGTSRFGDVDTSQLRSAEPQPDVVSRH